MLQGFLPVLRGEDPPDILGCPPEARAGWWHGPRWGLRSHGIFVFKLAETQKRPSFLLSDLAASAFTLLEMTLCVLSRRCGSDLRIGPSC